MTALVCVCWVVLYLSGARIIHENGPMENQQAVCLGLAAIAFALAGAQAKARHEKLFALSLAFFCLMFLLRELELERANLPDELIFLLTGKPRNLLVLACWIPLAAVVWRIRRPVWQTFTRWLATPAGRLMLVAGVLYGLTWPLDKEFLPLPKRTSVFMEELGDSVATLLMFFSGVLTSFSTQAGDGKGASRV